MASPTGTPRASPTVDRRWIWGVRIMTLVWTLPLCAVLLVTFVPGLWKPCADSPAPWLFLLVPLTLPYLDMLLKLRLRGRPDKRGVALAVVTGSVWAAVSLLYLVGALWIAMWKAALTAALSMSAQGALVTSAIMTYRSMELEADDRRKLAYGFFASVFYFALIILAAVAVPGLYRSRGAANESMAVGGLRTINTAEITYLEMFDQGFSPTLTALGPGAPGAQPTPSAANLIDGVLAGGRKSEYTFTYTAGRRDAKGKITTYAITARPSDPGCTEWRSFFTDESGVIRWARGSRPVTASDPPL